MAGEFKPKLSAVHAPPIEKQASLTVVRPISSPSFTIIPFSKAKYLIYLQLLVKELLSLRKKVLAIAAVQLLICTLFPGRFAIVPVATLVTSFVVLEVINRCTPSATAPPNYLASAVPGRTSSLLPRKDGTFGSSPSSQSLVLFNIGVQFNHSLGRFCPGGKEIAEKFLEMNAHLCRRRDELGLLSVTDWVGNTPETTNMLLTTFYFRDVESIHKFAHEELHRQGWDWYNAARLDHIGVFHETFVVPAHSYETIYVQCKPLLLGKGLVRCEEMEGTNKWRNTLVCADSLELKSQWQRMNRDMNGCPKE